MTIFSFEKSKLTREQLTDLVDKSKIEERNKVNIETALSSDSIIFEQGIFGMDYNKLFTLDGSIKTKSDPSTGVFGTFYITLGRLSKKGDDYILHGPRYLTAVDPTLVVSQKLRIFEKDFVDSLDILTSVNANRGAKTEFLEYAGVLDYLKNSVVSILNALLQEEKLGKFKIDNLEYQKIRQKLLQLATSSICAFYFHLIGEFGLRDKSLSEVASNYESFTGACSYILNEYQTGIFSSKYFTRPESTHPLVILSSVFTGVQHVKEKPDTIIGLPSGGTELAIAQKVAFEYINDVHAEIVLIPLSLHSIKDAFGISEVNDQGFQEYLASIRSKIKGKNIVLSEDNSSTGRTIQKMYDLLLAAGAANIEVFVSEADVIRSQIDIDDEKREFIAAQETYNSSVNILPISKFISPKVDLREILEKRRLLKFNKEKINMQNSEVEKFVAKVLARMTEEPTETKLSKLNDMNSIQSFRTTFLSNFYACEVVYAGKTYSSVEHAYQAQKFTDEELDKVTKDEMEEIHELLRTRGILKKYKKAKEIFEDPDISSGNVKLIADILRNEPNNHVRKDWDERRMEVMANLLLQKYRNPDLRDRLKGTGNKYLVEGNSWGDTLWGVSDGKGRNMLGQMLMIIREEM